MTAPNTAIAATGMLIAGAAASPLAQVFNELGLVFAIMGGFGGVTRWLAIRLAWAELGRGAILGALFGFGFGVISPEIISRIFDIAVVPGTAAVPSLAAAAFIIGFMQDVIIAWLRTRAKRGGPGNE